MAKGWGHVLVLFGFIFLMTGKSLHSKSQFKRLLSMAQDWFNSSSSAPRIAGFNAWRRMILNFSFDNHLYHSRRLNTILLPIWNCLQFEKSSFVIKACIETFVYLIMILSRGPLAFTQNEIMGIISQSLTYYTFEKNYGMLLIAISINIH